MMPGKIEKTEMLPILVRAEGCAEKADALYKQMYNFIWEEYEREGKATSRKRAGMALSDHWKSRRTHTKMLSKKPRQMGRKPFSPAESEMSHSVV